MLLYFSSEKNVNIFDKQAQELGIHIDLVLERDFTGYIETNSTKLNHLQFLAIDLENVIDDEIELINSLSAFRTCNSKVNIIIVSFQREKGDSLLGKLFAESIFNFVTSKDEEIRELEIKSCFEKTNNYGSALGYRVENFEVQKTTDKKGFFNNFFNNMKKIKKEKVYKKDISKSSKSKKEKNKDEICIQQSLQNQVENKEQNKTTSLVEKIQSKERNNTSEDFDNKVISIFENTYDRFDRFKQEKRRLKMEIDKLKDDVFLFYYYQKPVGIIFENVCIIDTLYEKEDIKKFFIQKNMEIKFKDNILAEIQELIEK